MLLLLLMLLLLRGMSPGLRIRLVAAGPAWPKLCGAMPEVLAEVCSGGAGVLGRAWSGSPTGTCESIGAASASLSAADAAAGAAAA